MSHVTAPLRKRTRKRTLFSFAALLSLIVLPPLLAGDPIDRVVASVNGSVITKVQLDRRIEALARFYGQPDGPSKGRVPPAEVLRRFAIEQLVNDELLIQRTRGTFRRNQAEKFAVRETDRRIEELKKSFGEEEFLARLSAENQTLAEFRTLMISEIKRQNLVASARRTWIDEFLLTPVSEAQVEAYLEEHPELREKDGLLEVQLVIQLILVRVPSEATEIEQAALEKKANRVLNKAKAGEPYEELVRTFSQHDESRRNDGLFELLNPTTPFAEFAPVFDLRPGQIYPEPIRIPAGWAIAKVSDKKNLYQITRRAIAEKKFEDAIKEARDEAKLIYDPELFSDIEDN